jgi:hypothetical protein
MESQSSLVKKQIKKLDPRASLIVNVADKAQDNKFHVVRIKLLSTALITIGSIGITLAFFLQIMNDVLQNNSESLKHSWYVYPVMGLVIFIIDIIALERINNYRNIKNFYSQYYLYLHPEYLIERFKNRITIIPKSSLLYAYEKYSYYDFHISYKRSGLSTLRYCLVNMHDIHYKESDTKGKPSLMRKKIMETYNLKLPKNLEILDNKK